MTVLLELNGSYDELLVKLKKQCKLNEALSKENEELKNDLVKLEAMLTRKDAELGKQSLKIDLAEKTFQRMEHHLLDLMLCKKKERTKHSKRKFMRHYCRRYGHIKPYCRDWIMEQEKRRILTNKEAAKAPKFKPRRATNLKRKEKLVCNIMFAASSLKIGGAWYFDSACSHHMTGSRDQLIDFQPIDEGMVTYGSGSKGKNWNS